MKKILLILFVFLLYKNTSTAQRNEFSGGIGAVFMRNTKNVYINDQDYGFNYLYSTGSGFSMKRYSERFERKIISSTFVNFTQSLSGYFSYKYKIPKKHINVKIGAEVSFWQQKILTTHTEIMEKGRVIDTTTEVIGVCGNGYHGYPYLTESKYKSNIINIALPLQFSLPYKKWEFGIGTSFNVTFLTLQEQFVSVNGVPFTSFTPLSKTAIEKGRLSSNLSIIRWLNNGAGLQLSASSFLDIAVQDLTFYRTRESQPKQLFLKYIVRL